MTEDQREIRRKKHVIEYVQKMTCTSKGTFHLDGERLRSVVIQFRQFASLCRLEPGEYEYRVELTSGVGGTGGSNLGRSFVGKIRVSE